MCVYLCECFLSLSEVVSFAVRRVLLVVLVVVVVLVLENKQQISSLFLKFFSKFHCRKERRIFVSTVSRLISSLSFLILRGFSST